MTVANAHDGTFEGERDPVAEAYVFEDGFFGEEALSRAHVHGPGFAIDPLHENRLRARDAEPFALPDGEAMHALVMPHHMPGFVEDRARPYALRGPVLNERGVGTVTRTDEAEFLRLGLGGPGQTVAKRLGSNFRFRGFSQGK